MDFELHEAYVAAVSSAGKLRRGIIKLYLLLNPLHRFRCKMKWIKFECPECKTIFTATSSRWEMIDCPKCGKVSVDLEEEYCRLVASKNGKYPTQVDSFDPPHFMDRDDYHSALIGWLNDSNELYTIHKDNQLLIVTKLR